MNIKLSDLTRAGWLLTLITIALVIVLMMVSAQIWYDILPRERYPPLLLAAPGLVLVVAFFMIGSAAFKAAGYPVVKPPSEPPTTGSENRQDGV
jgi:uncharacterized BrkB/YihY/UPF0761 family membrane protein